MSHQVRDGRQEGLEEGCLEGSLRGACQTRSFPVGMGFGGRGACSGQLEVKARKLMSVVTSRVCSSHPEYVTPLKRHES